MADFSGKIYELIFELFKMKIGLISFHNAINYGASLQAFALQRALEVKGHNAVYINYVNRHRTTAYDMKYQLIQSLRQHKWIDAVKYLLGMPFMALRKKRFKLFYRKFLKTTAEEYHSSTEAKTISNCFDKFIVGSDQVWNPENNGEDNAFLLDFVEDNSKKIAYSSSFGLSEVPSSFREDYKKHLSTFTKIAVREEKGAEIVQSLIGYRPLVVLDPVFLISKDEWTKIANPPKGNYVFSYTNRTEQFENFIAITGYNIRGLVHHKLARNTTPVDFLNPHVKVRYTMSPESFIGTILNAQLIVTASFHCLALSIILNKPFVAILTGDEGKDERLISLLRKLDLTDRILTEYMTNEDVMGSIDYMSVNKKIAQLKNTSESYLIQAINTGI